MNSTKVERARSHLARANGKMPAVDAASPATPPARGPAAVAEALIRSGAFVGCVFHCPACGLAGTSLVRPAGLPGKACAGCGEPVVLSVLDRA